MKTLEKLIENGKCTFEEKGRQKEAVRAVVQYCQNEVDCRRVQVLGHFGQKFDPKKCNRMCDNCAENGDVVEEDMTEAAQNAINLVRSLGSERVTKNNCVAILRGSKMKEIVNKGYDQQQLFGAGQHMSLEKVERLFNHLIHHGGLRLESTQNSMGWHNEYIKVSFSISYLCDWDSNRIIGRKPCWRLFRWWPGSQDEVQGGQGG